MIRSAAGAEAAAASAIAPSKIAIALPLALAGTDTGTGHGARRNSRGENRGVVRSAVTVNQQVFAFQGTEESRTHARTEPGGVRHHYQQQQQRHDSQKWKAMPWAHGAAVPYKGHFKELRTRTNPNPSKPKPDVFHREYAQMGSMHNIEAPVRNRMSSRLPRNITNEASSDPEEPYQASLIDLAVVVPLHKIGSLHRIQRTWSMSAPCKVREGQNVDLIIMTDISIPPAEFQHKSFDCFMHVYQSRPFIPPSYDTYAFAPPYQFFTMMLDRGFSGRYQAIQQMEADVVPLKNGWLLQMLHVTRSSVVKSSNVWVRGALLGENHGITINGNAIYNLQSKEFMTFLQDYRAWFHYTKMKFKGGAFDSLLPAFMQQVKNYASAYKHFFKTDAIHNCHLLGLSDCAELLMKKSAEPGNTVSKIAVVHSKYWAEGDAELEAQIDLMRKGLHGIDSKQ